MISTLVEMLGRFYANNDLANVEVLARNIHAAVPCDQVSLLFLGLAYYKTGRSNEALNTFDKVSATRESKTDHSLKKDEPGLPARDSAAIACYEEATRRSPLLARLWYDLGGALLELRKFDLAIPAFRNSLKAQPTDAAYRGLGQVYRLRRNFAAARECFGWVRKLRLRLAANACAKQLSPAPTAAFS
jgi:tetratricopeptide (TPR) repeat protein